jgi:hypothetical protein
VGVPDIPRAATTVGLALALDTNLGSALVNGSLRS